MGRIIQTKQASRASGGPQYYLHDLEVATKTLLRQLGKCDVWLGTPYGAVTSGLIAVAADKVVDGDRTRPGKVGHDRLQRRLAAYSVEGEIVRWYGLQVKTPLRRIDFREKCYHSKATGKYAILIMPERVVFQNGKSRALPFEHNPLTFTEHHRSNLVIEQICRTGESELAWAKAQIGRVLDDHLGKKVSYLGEEDLLRTSGALSRLGVHLGPYRRKGYDCMDSDFQFGRYPSYRCPVEVKKKSSGFDYQILKRVQPERAVVLCLTHPSSYVPPDVVDIIELRALYQHL